MYVVERDDTINGDRTIRFFNKKENAEKLFKKLKEEALEEYGEYKMEESEGYLFIDSIYLYITMFEAHCEDDEIEDLLDSN